MTGCRCRPCLLSLAILLLICKALGKPAANNLIYSDMNPLVGSAPIHESSHHTHLGNRDRLFVNVDHEEDPVSTTFKVINISDTVMTTLRNLNARIGANHEEALRTELMMANILQDSRFLRCSLFPIMCKHTKSYSTAVTSNNMSVGNADYERLQSAYSPHKLRSGYVNSVDSIPPVSMAGQTNSRVAEPGNNNEDMSRAHSIISNVNLQNTPKRKVRARQRTRFVRDTGRDDAVDVNNIWANLPFLLSSRPEVEFGTNHQNNVFENTKGDALVDEYAKYQVPTGKISLDSSQEELHLVPVIYNSPSETNVVSDSNMVYPESDLDNDISDRNIYEILQSLAPYSDDDSGDPMEESTGFTKRDNRYRDKMRELLKQSTGDSVRVPLQDRHPRGRETRKHERFPEKEGPLKLLVLPDKEACHLESEGTKPLRCPSDKSRCLYDTLICDGTADCPEGEDETFSLCVFRHWTFKFMKKFFHYPNGLARQSQ